jgi:hypothetical protein
MAFAKKTDEIAVIKEANIVTTKIKIRGTAPLVINKFSAKARGQMMAAMSTPKNEKKAKTERAVRDYHADYMGARHIAPESWDGIAASAFKNSMISACRTVGAVMTKSKLSLWIIADGFDKDDGMPLVKIISKKEPEVFEALVRNDNGGADVRVRPLWRDWSAVVTVQFDADMITASSVVNLLDRAGKQVGICEGRQGSKDSCGMGWGSFEVVTK